MKCSTRILMPASSALLAAAAAHAGVMPAVQVNTWQAFDGGRAKVASETLGIAWP